MSANAIVYCLEHLTDYFQFERLCSDLMHVSGYSNIEPLGGSNDRGRDAIFVSRGSDGDTTIFAYSVRADWLPKLRKDCKRIKEESHELSTLVFVSNATISASDRDTAIEEVQRNFGWRLDLYGMERLRVRLSGDAAHLVAQHPAIFVPPFFPTSGGLSVAESHDTVVIDHTARDHALATWLARRLQLLGFRTWCYGTAPLAGENADSSVRELIEKRALRYLPVLSDASLNHPDILGRCGMAANRTDLTIVCRATEFDCSRLPGRLKDRATCDFHNQWSEGLDSLLTAFESSGIRPTIDADQGRAIALRAYAPVPVVKESPEAIYASWFAMTLPDIVNVYPLAQRLQKTDSDNLQKSWPHVLVSNRRALSFSPPPDSVELVPHGQPATFMWRHCSKWEGVATESLIRSLLYKCLENAYECAGLNYCEHRRKYYYKAEDNPNYNVRYIHVDGRSTYASLTGEVTWGSGERAEPFRYQVCPNFSVNRDEMGEWWLGARLYIRVTDKHGKPFEEKAIGKRRKKVVKSWWNKKWFAITLAMMKSLSQGKDDLVIGEGSHAVLISTMPLTWECPVSIDHEVLASIGDFQQEMAQLSYREEAEDDDD